MLLRVRSRVGVQKLSTPVTTIQDLRRAIAAELNITETQQTSLTARIPRKGQISLLESPASLALSSLGLMTGDLVELASTQTSQTPEQIAEQLAVARDRAAHLSATNSSQGSASGPLGQATVSSVTSPDGGEDPIDSTLRKVDGWVKRPRSRYCVHPPNGTCAHCWPISPWSVASHEDFAALKLKHIAFHAWLREKEYRNSKNPVVLEDPSYKMEIPPSEEATAGAMSSKFNFTVTLERQTYRHVDHVEFDTPALVEKFISGWRETGKQRCGYLFGKYIPDPSIPLGIRAIVSAIYEPPQNSTKDNVALLKDVDEERINQTAQALGLAKIGFIWTSLLINEQKKIIPDRDPNTFHLKSAECVRMGLMQQKHPSPCRDSTSGAFGSKFVSVLVYGNTEGNIEVAAYQLSNQVSRLIRDGVVGVAKEPQFLRVKKPKDKVIFPDVYYRDKNEYGVPQTMKADPNFPNEYGIVSVRHSFPKDPTPFFRSFDFEHENRISSAVLQSGPRVLEYLKNQHGPSFFTRLSDFHLLIYIQKYLDPTFFQVVLTAVTDPTKAVETQFRPKLEATFASSASSSAGKPSAATTGAGTKPSSTSSAGSNSSSASGGYSDPRHADMAQQLMLMGFTEQQAKEALQVTNYASAEHAANYLLSQ